MSTPAIQRTAQLTSRNHRQASAKRMVRTRGSWRLQLALECDPSLDMAAVWDSYGAALEVCRKALRDGRENRALAPNAIRTLFALAHYPGLPSVLTTDAWHKLIESVHRKRSRAAANAIKRGEQLSNELQKHAIEVLRRDAKIRTRRTQKTGPEPCAYAFRNEVIAWAVGYLTRYCGFHETRNVATYDRHSACSLVSNALREFGIKLSENRISEIYRLCHP
jgi:hypothetical protein